MSDPATYHDFVSLFLRGDLRCSMLYPAYYNKDFLYPTVPAPYGLLTCSVMPFRGNDAGHGIFPAWEPEREQCPKCKSRLEPVGQYVVYHQNVGPCCRNVLQKCTSGSIRTPRGLYRGTCTATASWGRGNIFLERFN